MSFMTWRALCRQIIVCHLNQEMRVQHEFDDVASTTAKSWFSIVIKKLG